MSVAMRSTAYVCGYSIAGSNLAEGMGALLLCSLCVVQVEAIATSQSLVQRSPAGCVCVCVCV